jgi:LEA14-like dessication related protein
LLWVAVLAAAGCAVRELTREEVHPPKVTFQGLAVYQPTSDGWPLAANLLLENTNPRPLNLLGYDYQVWIEGRLVATGSSQEAVNLPAGGQAVAHFPILVKIDALLGFLPMLLQNPQQKVHYQISGSFRLASLMGGMIPVPFRFQGEAAPREGLEFLRPYLR